jgi:hypothetical protein
MAILREFRCLAHGPFEAFEPECPHGCSARFVAQEIRTAPGLKSAATKVADREIGNLAKSYGMTNIPTSRDGESVMDAVRRGKQMAPTWGEVEHNAPGWSQREGETAKTFNPQAIGAQPDNVVTRMKPVLSRGPTPIVVNKTAPA